MVRMRWGALSLLGLALAAAPTFAAPTKPAASDRYYVAPDDLMNDPCAAKTLAEEEALCRKRLAAMEKAHGPQSREVADAAALLARKIRLQGRLSEAEPLDRRALTIILRLVDAPPPVETDASFKTYKDAELFYVGDALVTDLLRQDRKLEADLVKTSLRPYDPKDLAHADLGSYTEYGVSSLPGVIGAGDPDPAPVIRAPTAEEVQTRTSLRAQAGADDAQSLFAQSEPLYRSIVALDETTFGPANWETARDLRALAFNLFLQKRTADAAQIETQAADIEAKRPLATAGAFESRDDVVLKLLNDAAILEKRSQDGDAEVLWREALRLDPAFRNTFAENGDRAALGLAENLRRQGKLAEAEGVYEQALKYDYAALDHSHPRILHIAQAVAQVRVEEGKLGPAVEAYRQACGDEKELVAETKRGERASLTSTPLEEAFASCTEEQALAMVAWAQQGGGQATSDEPSALAADAFVAAQASMPSSAGDALARAAVRIATASGAAAQDAAQFERDLAERDVIDQELPGAGDAMRETLKQRKAALDTEIATEAFTLEAKNPAYWDFRSPQPVTVDALQARIGPDAKLLRRNEAVVLWMVAPGDHKGLVFAVSKAGFAWAPTGLTGDEIADKVKTLRFNIDPDSAGRGAPQARSEDAEPFDRATAHDLYLALLGDKKVDAVINAAGIDTLIVVPSGPLTRLPPGLLVVDEPKGMDRDPAAVAKTHWLIRDKAIAVLPAVSSLKTLRELLPKSRKVADLKLLALADPDFKGDGTIPAASEGETRSPSVVTKAVKLADLPPLYSTLAEGRTLAGLLDPGDANALLIGPEASKTNLLKRVADKTLGRTQVVAFSTHGLLPGELVGLNEPALALAQPPKTGADPTDDGLLKASEAAALTLNADWVVLSACNTAAGDASDTEGLAGLARAFFHAGASTLLVSHWRVDDNATEQLITQTFHFRKAGQSKAQSLRAAMLEMIDEPGREHVEPRYWAPFVVVGEPQ